MDLRGVAKAHDSFEEEKEQNSTVAGFSHVFDWLLCLVR